MLLHLIAATGHSLEGTLAPARAELSAPLQGSLGRRVLRHRELIRKIADSYGVGNVRVFGNVARGAERADADIDLLLDLPAGAGLFTVGRLRRDLEDLLHARVGLVPADGLESEARAEVESDLVTL